MLRATFRSARSTSIVQKLKLFDAAATTAETKGIAGGPAPGHDRFARRHCARSQSPALSPATDGYAVSTLTVVGFTDAQVTQMVGVVDKTLAEMADAATNLGAAKKQIDLQKEFTTSLMDSIERGVGQLVDADMNKESTRLQALQVQQQLGIQALSIANSNAQRVLSLFQN